MLKRKLILALGLMAMALPLMAQPEAGTFSIIPKVGVYNHTGRGTPL